MSSVEVGNTRGELILQAAIEAFGTVGVRGTSLRELAKGAGSSLSLIAHHYGSKPSLVVAAVAQLHAITHPQVERLRRSLETESDLEVERLVELWLRYVQAVFGQPLGATYLRMMLRLQVDPEIDDDRRHDLDRSQPCVRRALRILYPEATSAQFDLAWDAASGAIYGAALGGEHSISEARFASLQEFVVAGLKASLEG